MSMQAQIESFSWLDERSTFNTMVIGRLKDGITRQEAETRLDPIAAAIANEFSEADSPIYLSSLIALGFTLFIVTFVVLSIAKFMLMQLQRREGR